MDQLSLTMNEVEAYIFGMNSAGKAPYFEREFNTTLSADTISSITDRVLPEITAWKSRMLDPVYAILPATSLIGMSSGR